MRRYRWLRNLNRSLCHLIKIILNLLSLTLLIAFGSSKDNIYLPLLIGHLHSSPHNSNLRNSPARLCDRHLYGITGEKGFFSFLRFSQQPNHAIGWRPAVLEQVWLLSTLCSLTYKHVPHTRAWPTQVTRKMPKWRATVGEVSPRSHDALFICHLPKQLGDLPQVWCHNSLCHTRGH